MNNPVKYELLYFDGCPSWQEALENLRQALQAEGLSMDVSLFRVEGNDHAISVKFRGSPTIRIGGDDLFPEESAEYGLSCRVYQTEIGLRGWPTAPMIRRRLHALGASRTPGSTGDSR